MMLRFHSVACIFYSYVAGDMYVGGLYADAHIHLIHFSFSMSLLHKKSWESG